MADAEIGAFVPMRSSHDVRLAVAVEVADSATFAEEVRGQGAPREVGFGRSAKGARAEAS